MHILPSDLNIFPKVLIRRICLTIRSFLSWWSFPFGECYSRLGILGLQRCAQRFDCHEYVKKILWRFLSLPPEPPGPPSKENVKKKKLLPNDSIFLPLEVDGCCSSATADDPLTLLSFDAVNALVGFVVSRFSILTNDSTLDFSFSSTFPASSASCFFFCFSKAFIFLAASVFWCNKHSKIASLSYRNPSGVTTGSRQGCSVKQQQSKFFTESLPRRTDLLPYPDFLVSFFRSW